MVRSYVMTPSEIYAKLTTFFPEFITYWESSDNYHRNEDGSFTLCGVFSQFSAFVRERLPELHPSSLDALGCFVEDCMALPSASDLRNAAGACFLENVAGEDFTPALAVHFGKRAREILSYYGPVA